MKPELIIFDWDGTLADTTRPIIRTFQQSFADCGLKAPDADAIRALIGYSLPEIIFRLAPDAGEHLREELAETYAAHYLNPNNHNMTLFPEAIPCLNTLKQQGFWLAVATGKGRTGLDRSIMQTGTADFWMATACASEYASKPARYGFCLMFRIGAGAFANFDCRRYDPRFGYGGKCKSPCRCRTDRRTYRRATGNAAAFGNLERFVRAARLYRAFIMRGRHFVF